MLPQPVALVSDISAYVSAVLLRVPAGFPSPAQGSFEDGRINLNDVLIHDVTSTFILRVSGNSMEGAGICDGDEVLVDRSITPRDGDVVIAVHDGEFTIATAAAAGAAWAVLHRQPAGHRGADGLHRAAAGAPRGSHSRVSARWLHCDVAVGASTCLTAPEGNRSRRDT